MIEVHADYQNPPDDLHELISSLPAEGVELRIRSTAPGGTSLTLIAKSSEDLARAGLLISMLPSGHQGVHLTMKLTPEPPF